MTFSKCAGIGGLIGLRGTSPELTRREMFKAMLFTIGGATLVSIIDFTITNSNRASLIALKSDYLKRS